MSGEAGKGSERRQYSVKAYDEGAALYFANQKKRKKKAAEKKLKKVSEGVDTQ